MSVSEFIKRHYRHFNAATLHAAAKAYRSHIDAGGKMVVSLGGAMSTAELGLSLAEMIREGKVHAISCTGANLEEDVLNLIAHKTYAKVEDWRNLSAVQEQLFRDRHLSRVTDTCIPDEAVRLLEEVMAQAWSKPSAATPSDRRFPHEFLYQVLRSGRLKENYQIDPRDSWVLAAAEADLPIVVPGWEDSTLGNCYAALLMKGELADDRPLRTGIEYMIELANWYARTASTIACTWGHSPEHSDDVGSIGLLQVGGGIAGDFPICAVPMLRQTLGRTELPMWGYFCQVSDAPASYGGYSGAVPNEKITWGKLAVGTPKFVIESDATIVVPLIFAYVLGW